MIFREYLIIFLCSLSFHFIPLSLSPLNCPPHLFLLFPPYRRTQMSQITFLFPLNFWEASLSTTFSKFSPYWMLKLHKFGIISEFRGKKNRKKCQIISPSIASHFLSLNFTLEHPFSLSKSSTLKIWKSKLNLISWPKKRFFFFFSFNELAYLKLPQIAHTKWSALEPAK